MKVEKISKSKKQFLELLLLADEQEDMIDRYLEYGEMFALYDDDLKGICVVIQKDNITYELKNMAIYEKYQGKGYGKALVKYIFDYYKGKCKTIIVGTGDSHLTIPFYENCGFHISHRVKNFFIDNYVHAIFEDDVQLIDMIYMKIYL
jgi:GNAT superfamily N-acetyltransferase